MPMRNRHGAFYQPEHSSHFALEKTASAIRCGARPPREKGTVFAQHLSIDEDPRRDVRANPKSRRERLEESPRELRVALRLSAPAYPNARQQ